MVAIADQGVAEYLQAGYGSGMVELTGIEPLTS
jgi:hypothetical protein